MKCLYRRNDVMLCCRSSVQPFHGAP
uniref:Uncharacterized protein n=1 Tax=Arundo donax TaxID=35708 RepID=A0A0A8ZRY0_ARUDO